MGFAEKLKAFTDYFSAVFKKKTRDVDNTVTDALAAGRDFCKCARCGSHYSLRKLFGTEKAAYVCKWCYEDTYRMADSQAQSPEAEAKVRYQYFGIGRKERRALGRTVAKKFDKRAKVALAE